MKPEDSPLISGDHGEDDGMGMEMAFNDLQNDGQTSYVESAEKRDMMPSMVENEQLMHKAENTMRSSTKKSKSMVAGVGGGNYLRVRSNSNATQPGFGARTSVTSNVLDNPEEAFDFFYKIIIIGDEITGKTNFLLRVVKGYFDPKPKTPYGVEFLFKTVPLSSNQKVKAQIWDTSGAREFLSITTTHYRFAVGAFLVYDVTNI